jgi:hypothetical protein
MSSSFLRINGTTRVDRHEMISQLRDCLTQHNGWIVDFQMFSNLSICINFEISSASVEAFRQSLNLLDAKFTADQAPATITASEIRGTLQMTFTHDQPDLRIEVPAIPG